MASVEALFKNYWDNWLPLCPSAKRVMDLLQSKGETVVNDHIALRTLAGGSIGIDLLAEPFLECGYEFGGEYHFEAKKLYARHLEVKSDPEAPKVFISELLCEKLDASIQPVLQTLRGAIENHINTLTDIERKGVGYSGRTWDFDHAVFENLAQHSEYAAWFYSFGFRANHFTISVNHLTSVKDIASMNALLVENGFVLNDSGGAIKGSPTDMLVQSSTRSDHIEVEDYTGGKHSIPGCYIEFAHRFPDANNRLFTGFVTPSADKIFESTNQAK